MIVCKFVPQYNQNTGQPTAAKLERLGWICDHCGALHNRMEEDVAGQVTYAVYESGDIEPNFHEMRVKGFPKIDMYSVFGSAHKDFQYCYDFDTNRSCERDMMQRYMKAKKGKTAFVSLSEMMYEARLLMIAEVLKANTYTLEELLLETR